MTKTSRKPPHRPDDDDDDDDNDFKRFGVPIDSAGVEQVQSQVGELPEGAKVNVYRMRPGVRPPFAFLEQMGGAHFDLADIKARFGGGEFMIRAWQKGVNGFLVNERFSIEGDPIVVKTLPPAAPMVMQSGPGMPSVITLPAQGGDAVMALASMFTQAIDRLGAMIVQNQRPQHGMREALELLTIAKAIVAPQGAVSDPLGMLTQVMGIMREAQPLLGEGGRADGFTILQTAVEKVLPAIIARLPVNAPPVALPEPGFEPAAPNPPMPTAHNPPMPTGDYSLAEAAARASQGVAAMPSAPAMPIPGGGGQPNIFVSQVIGTYVPMFVQAASIGAAPGTYADNVVDMLDAQPAAEPAVRAFLARPDWVDELARYAPAVMQHRAWFLQLGREVIDILDTPAEGEGANDGIAGAEGEHFRQ